MSGDVALGHHRILCFQQDLAIVIGEYRSEGIIAGCRGARRDLKGSSEQLFIPRGKLVFHFGRDQLYTISYRWNDAVQLPTRDAASQGGRMSIAMTFRVKIISPIKVDEADLRRRQIRYAEHAAIDTRVQVFNLEEGPTSLDTPGDLLFCEHAVFLEGLNTDPDEFDAILIDCVFDPALEPLREQAPIATFGPMLTTLPMVAIVADRFAYIARAERQTEWLAEIAEVYGYGDQLVSSRALGISYQESRKPKIFDDTMSRQIEGAITDGAGAVVMGSTTMALSDKVKNSAGTMPLFLPGMVALRAMEHLWSDGLLSR